MAANESTLLSSPTLDRTQPGSSEILNWKLLKFFNAYRLTISGASVAISLWFGSFSPFGVENPFLFRIASLIYFGLALIGLLTIRSQKPDFESQATALAFADITLLTLLMHTSGGLSSGLGLLLIVAIAGVSLMLGKRVTIFYAAAATIAALLQHSWAAFTGDITSVDVEGFPQVGLLGIGMFATAALGFTLATRLRATEVLADRRGAAVASLKHINELIIERMQSGVLVCNAMGEIRFINQAGQKFLGVRITDGKKFSLSDVSPDLAIQLFQWLGNNPQRSRHVFTTRTNYALLPRFVPLNDSKDTSVLVFLDDMAALKQQAQQLKIAALARLTASIAHEIRNPLGAITNAAQLLGESVLENSEQRRLTKIIEEQGRRMNITIQNVTQLSRRDRVNPERLALKSWLTDFVNQFCETLQIPHDTFTLVGPEMDAIIDPDQFNQVLSNLCQNALRASPPFTGTPLIKLQTGKDAENRSVVDVIDWGSGVPPAVVDNIFDPFFTTSPKGTGLGLYIARELCEGNGAVLDYGSGEGGVGSRFRVTFARAEDSIESATNAAA